MSLDGRRVLVTGAAGRLGSRLVGELLARGADVRAFDDGSTGDFARLAAHQGAMELQRGDVRDAAAVARACEGREVVFHLAARETGPALELHAVNAEGALGVLEAARGAGVARVVVASRESSAAPHAAVTIQQRCAERYAALYASLYGLPALALRYDPAPGAAGGAEAGREARAPVTAALSVEDAVRLTCLAGDPDRALHEASELVLHEPLEAAKHEPPEASKGRAG